MYEDPSISGKNLGCLSGSVILHAALAVGLISSSQLEMFPEGIIALEGNIEFEAMEVSKGNQIQSPMVAEKFETETTMPKQGEAPTQTENKTPPEEIPEEDSDETLLSALPDAIPKADAEEVNPEEAEPTSEKQIEQDEIVADPPEPETIAETQTVAPPIDSALLAEDAEVEEEITQQLEQAKQEIAEQKKMDDEKQKAHFEEQQKQKAEQQAAALKVEKEKQLEKAEAQRKAEKALAQKPSEDVGNESLSTENGINETSDETGLDVLKSQTAQSDQNYGVNSGTRSYLDIRQRPGNIPPQYPEQSRYEKEQGQVLLQYFVTPDGRVSNIRVRKSSGYPRLDNEAVRAIAKYKFQPDQQGQTMHEVNFSLKGEIKERKGRLRTTSM